MGSLGNGMAGHVLLTFKAYEEDGQYVSTCEELDVASCGATLEAAFQAIEDATRLYLDVLADQDELRRVFAERGITVRAGEPPDRGEEVLVKLRPDEYVSPHVIAIHAAVA